MALASHGLAWPSLGLAQASGGVDGWTDGQNFSPFYRTLSPIEAAALLHIHIHYQIFKQDKSTADHMMPLTAYSSLEKVDIKKMTIHVENVTNHTKKVCYLLKSFQNRFEGPRPNGQ